MHKLSNLFLLGFNGVAVVNHRITRKVKKKNKKKTWNTSNKVQQRLESTVLRNPVVRRACVFNS